MLSIYNIFIKIVYPLYFRRNFQLARCNYIIRIIRVVDHPHITAYPEHLHPCTRMPYFPFYKPMTYFVMYKYIYGHYCVSRSPSFNLINEYKEHNMYFLCGLIRLFFVIWCVHTTHIVLYIYVFILHMLNVNIISFTRRRIPTV